MSLSVSAGACSGTCDGPEFAREHIMPSRTGNRRSGFLRYLIDLLIIGFGMKPVLCNYGGKSNDKIEKERHSAMKICCHRADFRTWDAGGEEGRMPVRAERRPPDHGIDSAPGPKGGLARTERRPSGRGVRRLGVRLSV